MMFRQLVLEQSCNIFLSFSVHFVAVIYSHLRDAWNVSDFWIMFDCLHHLLVQILSC